MSSDVETETIVQVTAPENVTGWLRELTHLPDDLIICDEAGQKLGVLVSVDTYNLLRSAMELVADPAMLESLMREEDGQTVSIEELWAEE